MGKGRLAVIAVLVAASMIVATGCKREVTKSVLFVNDSVTHQALGAMVTEFNFIEPDSTAGRYAPNFGSSVPGIGLLQAGLVPTAEVDAYWANHMSSLIERVDPEVIVVQLGYNDCDHDLTTYSSHIDNLMANIPPDTPVHWLTMQDAMHLYTCDEVINGSLAAAATRWPNLSLFDFGAFVEGHPEWLADGKHLNATGQHQYAKWLHARLDEVYVTGSTTTTSSSSTTSSTSSTTTSSTTTTTTSTTTSSTTTTSTTTPPPPGG